MDNALIFDVNECLACIVAFSAAAAGFWTCSAGEELRLGGQKWTVLLWRYKLM